MHNQIAIFVDVGVPFIVCQAGDQYSLVGEPHVQGIINGETSTEMKAKGIVLDMVELV